MEEVVVAISFGAKTWISISSWEGLSFSDYRGQTRAWVHPWAWSRYAGLLWGWTTITGILHNRIHDRSSSLGRNPIPPKQFNCSIWRMPTQKSKIMFELWRHKRVKMCDCMCTGVCAFIYLILSPLYWQWYGGDTKQLKRRTIGKHCWKIRRNIVSTGEKFLRTMCLKMFP